MRGVPRERLAISSAPSGEIGSSSSPAERGRKHKIAELCGDESLDPTGGVQFIEASWVEIPAFKGAVARNILTLSSDDKSKTARDIHRVFSFPSPKVPTEGYRKSARSRFAGDEGSEDGSSDETSEEPKAPASPDDPFKGITDDLKKHILDELKKSLKEDLSKSDLASALLSKDSTEPNDNVVKQARMKSAYISGVTKAVRIASGDRDFIVKIARLNRRYAIFVPVTLYCASLKVGGTHKYGSLRSFLGKCREVLGRAPTLSEARTMVRLSKLLTARRVGVKPNRNS